MADESSVENSAKSRRTKRDNLGKAAAFQRLKELKGSKNKVTIEEVENVYEEVDEREYSKRVRQRQEEDWIVDDDGSGYVEDGREVFDDDLDDQNVAHASKSIKHKGKFSSSKGLLGKTSNIKNMIINMPLKNKEKEAKIQDDDILGDIMQELNSAPAEKTPQRSITTALKKKASLPGGQSITSTPTSVPRNVGNSAMASRLVKAEPKRLPFAASSTTNDWSSQDSLSIDEFTSQPDDSPFLVDDTIAISQVKSQQENDLAVSELSTNCEPSNSRKHSEENFKMNQTLSETRPNDPSITSSWETMKTDLSADLSVTSVECSSIEIPIEHGEDGDQIMKMYWFDAYEDPYSQPGTVYLFGKVFVESTQGFVSCCVAVKNIEKHVYVLPRETVFDLKKGEATDTPVSFMDVYQEFDRVCERYKILNYKSKKSLKKYAFDPPTIPRESEYLEVKFPADHTLPANLKGSTFSHVFGANASSLENFLLEKRIKGPCWLNIKNPLKPNAPVSWCKVEATVNDMGCIDIASGTCGPPPPLTIMSVALRTVVNSRTQQVEIVSVGCLVHNEFHVERAAPTTVFQNHFCILSRPPEEPWPLDHKEVLGRARTTKIEKAESERQLLSLLLVKINKIDPDIVVGHDIASYDLDILLHRFQQTKIQHWSRIGRLKRNSMPNSKGLSRSQLAMSGRLVCDIKISARELIRARSYDIDALCQQVLRFSFNRSDQSSEAIRKLYSSSANLIKMIEVLMQDGANVLRIMYELNVLPLALQITSIAGNLLSRTLLGGRSERNEYLLLHAFYEKGYIVPDRQSNKKHQREDDSDAEDATEASARSKKGRRKPAYAGGLVLEPKRGFYDKFILLMDFNSLYPSIIQEYNICFTTVDRQPSVETKEGEEILPDLPDASLPTGILPTEIRKLVDSRREVKRLITDKLSKDLLVQYDIRQKALKLTANSMYGCLGFSNSRFYAKPLAALITSKGREILLQTRELVRKMNLDVVYGDTDSLMIDSNSNDYDQVLKLGIKIKQEVNKHYKHLELDIDGVFQRLLLLKKKKYAAVTVSQVVRDNKKEMVTQQEIKGLDIVRRDWSQLAIKAGRYALEQILGDLAADERIAKIQSELENIRIGFENNTINLSLLEITKQLTKNPENYPDAKNLSHVQVALRNNSRGGKKLMQGDTVSFIICEDGSNMAATQRAYSLEELKMPSNSHLKPDKHYYLAQQVHPVVSRLCELLEGMDAVRIAELLGLDTSGYRSSRSNSKDDHDPEDPPVNDEERFQACEKFYFRCPDKACGMEMAVENVFRRNDGGKIEFALSKCSNPSCKTAPVNYLHILQNRLTLTLRKYIQSYYSGWLTCEDQGCAQRSRRLPLKSVRGRPVCMSCGNSNMFLEYTDQDLYTQLCYFKHIFDVDKAKKKLQGIEKVEIENQFNQSIKKVYHKLMTQVQTVLSDSAYSQVNLASLFYSIQKTKNECGGT